MSETNPTPSKHPQADKWGAEMLAMLAQIDAIQTKAADFHRWVGSTDEIGQYRPQLRVNAMRVVDRLAGAHRVLSEIQNDLGDCLKQ